MMPPRLATLLLRTVLPARDRETLLGDLLEEYALIAQHAADRWYWRQAFRSVAPILWSNIRRGGWLKTLGVALAAYLLVSLAMPSESVLTLIYPETPFHRDVVYIALSFMVCAWLTIVAGYFAARMRSGAPVVLAAVVAVMGVVSLIHTGDRAPFWYQLFLIVIGPLGAIAGGRLYARRKEKRLS